MLVETVRGAAGGEHPTKKKISNGLDKVAPVVL